MTALSCEGFVSGAVPRATDLRMPDGSGLVSAPVSSTLTYGQRDAVLAGPSRTVAQTEALCDWIERSGKRLACPGETRPLANSASGSKDN
jgi:hypothetical protein